MLQESFLIVQTAVNPLNNFLDETLNSLSHFPHFIIRLCTAISFFNFPLEWFS